MFNTILLPVDRSIESRHAVDIAIDLIKKYQAQLVIVSVADTPELQNDPTPIKDFLAKMVASLAEVGIVAETKLEEGVPAFAICDVADAINADLIVMGSRGTPLTDEHPEDSVSQKVINLSPCPVLVVP